MPVPEPLPPIASQPLSVVLLAGGDAGGVEGLLEAWTRHLDARGQEYELILADDLGAAAEAAAPLTGRMPRLRVARGDGSHGEGAALRAALAEAKHPLLFYILCQPEYRPEFLGLLLDRPATSPGEGKEIDHAHVMTGCRAAVRVPLGLRVLGWLWRAWSWLVFSYAPPRLPGWLGWRGRAGWLFARVLFGIRYHDVSCPVRLIRRDVFARIPIQSDGSFVHVEVLAKANFLGCLMAEEVPLPLAPRPYRRDLALLWRDCKRMLRQPDFGPAVLGAPSTDPAPLAGGPPT
jgi:hypothetical protein